jgi:phosphoserine phosphatase
VKLQYSRRVEIVSSPDVLARIDRAIVETPSSGGAIAFDGDGTLWSGDVGDDLWADAVAMSVFRAPAAEKMAAEAKAFGVAADPPCDALAHALFEAYQAKRYPEERMYELMAWCFAGWSRSAVRRFCREVLQRRRHEEQLHREALAMVRWAQERGVRVLVVSASPRPMVEEAVAPAHVDSAHVLAATPRWDGEDTMLADVERPIPYGPGKVRAIREAIGDAPLWAAFGDNAFDVPMLQEAHVPVAVRPKDRLRARAAEVPRLIELARE